MSMSKKTIKLVMLGMCVMGLMACSEDKAAQSSAEQTTEQAKATGKQASTDYPQATVGVTISSIETNPFFQEAYKTAETVGKEQSNLTVLLDSADNDQVRQNAQLEEMKAKGAKAFVINLADIKQGSEVIKKYCGQVAMVFFNRNPGDKELAACPTAYFVDGDAIQAGVMQGTKVLELWKAHPEWDKNKDGKIQYAMLEGIPGHAGAMARTKWSISTMKSYPNISVPVESVFHDYAMFQTAAAKDMIDTWSSDPNFERVEVILANNDSMALGAVESLKAKDIKLPIFGIDAVAAAKTAIANGEMTATIFNDYDAQIRTALRLAANLATQKDPVEGISWQLRNKTILIPYQEVQ